MTEIRAKSAITKSRLPAVDYCFNPYIGCTHRCTYCYARFMGRFTGHANDEWGKYLDWKINSPDLLKKELPKIKKTGGTVIIGSVTDSYQPIEKQLRLTRESLKVFLDYQIPISILTKNIIAERDFDLLSQFDDCTFGVSLSLLNPEISNILEPGASPPQERINLLNNAHMSNIRTYLFLGPLHPFITPVSDILKSTLPTVDFVMAETPNLKCGNWNYLKESLTELQIDPDAYRRLAKSDEFYNENNDIITQICNKTNTEYQGLFRH